MKIIAMAVHLKEINTDVGVAATDGSMASRQAIDKNLLRTVARRAKKKGIIYERRETWLIISVLQFRLTKRALKTVKN